MSWANVIATSYFDNYEIPAPYVLVCVLTGIRKQSVEDVERLFGSSVIDFMKQHGYVKEEKYLRVVRIWRQAVDKRRLSDEHYCFCSEYLDYIVSDLIPWYSIVWHCHPLCI